MQHLNWSGAQGDDQLVTLWLAGRPESTQHIYKRTAARFLKSLKTGLQETTVADVIAWMDTLVGAPATRARLISTIKSLLSYAHRTGYTVFNVGRALRCVKVPSTLHEKLIEEELVRKLIDAAPEGRDKALIRFIYACGSRITETVKLRFIDVGKGRVTFLGKGTKTRTILVPDAILEPLRALRKPGDGPEAIVFRSYRNKPLGARYARQVVYNAAEKAGLTLSPHWLRHCHASHALDNGVPIHLLMRSLGHASLVTTSNYVHAKPTEGSSQYLRIL